MTVVTGRRAPGRTVFRPVRGRVVPYVMAASVTVTIPVVILVLLFQRRIVAGLTSGAVKG